MTQSTATTLVGYLFDFVSDGQVIRNWFTASWDEAHEPGHFNVRMCSVEQPAQAARDDAERTIAQLIDERDEREGVINRLLDLVLGQDRHEWSSAYGFDDAAREVEERLAGCAAPQPAQAVPQLTGCNCRWDGETQVQWCELHLAHKGAIHDWAERAKTAEAKLNATPQPAQALQALTAEQERLGLYDDTQPAPEDKEQALLAICRKFIADHEIRCAESIYQRDRVAENACQLIEDICGIAGYHQGEDE